jgi:hypothetical protein
LPPLGIFLSTPNIPKLKQEFQLLRFEVAGIELMKSVRRKQLKMLEDEIKRTIDKLFRLNAEY